MELFRGFITDEDEHSHETDKNFDRKHSHHHSHHHHHHSNHLHHDQTGDFEDYNNKTCAEIAVYESNLEPQMTSALANFNPEEHYLHTDLESPVPPVYHKE